MFPVPARPAFPSGQSAITTDHLRYEDVAQDGQLMPIAIPHAMGGLWREAIVGHPGARNALAVGVLPILTRLTIISTGQPIRVDRPVEARSGFALAQDGDGDTTRIFMNVWSELYGAAGRISRHDAGELALAGSLFAEHTFTRPLAPPEQRRVTQLDVDGYPHLPELRYAAPAATTAQEPPDGATWTDELAPDPAEYCMSLDQTDSNQHVNSLVYIRIFLDAVQRRVGGGKLHSRAVDIAYRKPCFAGDRIRSHVRRFTGGAAGFVAGDDGKPRCYVRIALA